MTVLIGTVAGVASPARRDTDHVGVDLDLRPGRVTLPLRADYEHALVILTGAMRVDGLVVEPGQLAYLRIGRDELVIDSLTPTRAMLVGGVPFDEPILVWWNYVACTRDEVNTAHHEWTANTGRDGHVDSRLPPLHVDPGLWSHP